MEKEKMRALVKQVWYWVPEGYMDFVREWVPDCESNGDKVEDFDLVRRALRAYISERYPLEEGVVNPVYGEELLGLPYNYWEFVMEWLPGYSGRDDVLLSDIYTRWLDGEDVCEDDLEAFFDGKRAEEASDELVERVEREYCVGEWRLVLDALGAVMAEY